MGKRGLGCSGSIFPLIQVWFPFFLFLTSSAPHVLHFSLAFWSFHCSTPFHFFSEFYRKKSEVNLYSPILFGEYRDPECKTELVKYIPSFWSEGAYPTLLLYSRTPSIYIIRTYFRHIGFPKLRTLPINPILEFYIGYMLLKTSLESKTFF